MTIKIRIPSADLNRDLEINMTEISCAEGRVDEIATVNTHKAPELLMTFIKAYTWCTEHITNITAEAIKAETAANFRKAEIILEEVPRILKEKGITGKSNEDYRNAVIAMDKTHIALLQRFHHLEMYRTMFKGKLESLDRSYMAIRKIYGSGMDFRNPNLGSNRTPDPEHQFVRQDLNFPQVTINPYSDPNSTGTPLAPPTVIVSSTNPLRAGFGRAKE